MNCKKYLILCIIVFTSIKNYSQDVWGTEVFLEVREKPLRYVLDEIRTQSNINLIFNDDKINDKIITCNTKSSVEDAITLVLNKTGLSYKKFDNNSAVIYKDKSVFKKFKTAINKAVTNDVFKPTSTIISKPILLSKEKLIYPQEAMNKGIEGEVFTKIYVTEKGDVTEVLLQKPSGYKILDTATINYVKRLKFLPAEYNGRPKSTWTTLVVKYSFE